MKRFHPLSLILACITLLLLGNSALAAKKKYDPGFLVVATAPSGTINQLANGNYSLKFDLPKAGQVLVYTERPLRTHFVISDKVLNRLWAAGPNSFAKNPPNATLSAVGQYQPIEIEVLSFKNTSQYALIEFKPLYPKRLSGQLADKKTLQHLVLTISNWEACGNVWSEARDCLSEMPTPEQYEYCCKAGYC